MIGARRRPRARAPPARRRLALIAALVASAWFAIPPLAAFDAASGGVRDVSASVVAEGTTYQSIPDTSCLCDYALGCDGGLGGTCTFTITNQGTTPVDYTITKTCACTWLLLITENPSGTINVGASETVDLRIGNNVEGAQSIATFTVDGAGSGEFDFQKTNVRVTIDWSVV